MNTYDSVTRLGLSCAVLLVAGFAARANAEEYRKAYVVDGRASVHVRASYGIARVTTWDTNKVEFDVTYDKADWATDLHIDSRQDGNLVELTAPVDPHSWWGWGHWGAHRLNIDVRMPRNADLQLETSNGGVDIASLNGNISIHTSNGNILAQQLSGSIDIGSSNGKMTLQTLKGSLKAHTSNGSINATGIDGKCELATSNGRIDATGRFESLSIASSNATVMARVESGSRMSSDWRLSSSNAGVDLFLPTDLKANLDASTSNAGIMVGLPITLQGYQSNGQVRGTLNGGGPEISIRTSNAGVRVSGI
jgi:hypothetical protein